MPLSDAQNKLSQFGKIVEQNWFKFKQVYSNLVLDEFVIMPNHIHGIIGFDGTPFSMKSGKISNLFQIIRGFKRFSTLEILKSNPWDMTVYGAGGSAATEQSIRVGRLIDKHNTIWQKSFYDHVIRNEKDLDRIREYIVNNPLQWELDELNPNRSGGFTLP